MLGYHGVSEFTIVTIFRPLFGTVTKMNERFSKIKSIVRSSQCYSTKQTIGKYGTEKNQT